MQRFQVLRRRNVWQRVAVCDARIASAGHTASMQLARSFSSLPSHEVVGMPALSPTMETGTIAKWLKQEGDLVSAGDIICQVETDKAVVDFEAQDDVYIAKILQPEGTADISVGDAIFVTVEEQDDVSAFASFSLADSESTASSSSSSSSASEPASTPTKEAAPPAPTPSTAPSASSSDRVVASPLAKKLARESGVLLSAINGTGPHGRIVKADVDSAIAEGTATASASASSSASATPAASSSPQQATPSVTHDYTDYPISSEAQQLAQQLTQQKLDVPHFHLSVDLHVDALLQARARLNAGLAEDAQLSVNDFLVRAASLAMRKVPEVNSAWQGSFIRQYHDTSVNLVVSSTAGGSVAPVLRNVNRKGLSEISADVRAAVAKANEQTLSGDDLATGTFTMSNVGMYDVRSLSGIVARNQASFLGLGVIEKKVVPNDDPDAEQIYKYAQVLTATLANDHRVVDGAVGAKWLAVFKELVEDPLKMIL